MHDKVLKIAQELYQHILACTSNFVYKNSRWSHSLSQILISFLLCNFTLSPYLTVGQMLEEALARIAYSHIGLLPLGCCGMLRTYFTHVNCNTVPNNPVC